MKIKVEKAGPCRKTLRVELPAEQVTAERVRVVEAWCRAAALPGFRKGKAPASLVEGHYAKDIEEEIKERLIATTYKDALQQEKLAPIAIMDLDVQLAKDQTMTYKITLDVPPEFKLPKYKGLALKAVVLEVSDEQVQQRFEALLDQLAKYEPVTDRPVRKGDLAQIDYTATYQGRPLAELDKQAAAIGQAKDFWVMADANAFLPGFDTGLLELTPGQHKEIKVTFPEDFKLKTLAGRSALYQVNLKAIREKKPPQLGEALFKELQVDSEAGLRAKLREALEEETRTRVQEELKDQACRLLLSKTALDLPASIVQEETQTMFASLVRSSLMRGMTQEQVAGQRDQLFGQATQSAADKVKLGYILHRIAEEEGIEASDSEIDAELQRLALRYQTSPEELRKVLTEKNELEAIDRQIRMHKTLDMILENAKIGEEGFFKRLMAKPAKAKQTDQ